MTKTCQICCNISFIYQKLLKMLNDINHDTDVTLHRYINYSKLEYIGIPYRETSTQVLFSLSVCLPPGGFCTPADTSSLRYIGLYLYPLPFHHFVIP